MFQFLMSVDKGKAGWFYDMERMLNTRVINCGGLMASKEGEHRVNISIACEKNNKPRLLKAVKEVVTDMYLTCAKKEFLSSVLNISSLDEEAYEILLHTLIVFDRDHEKDIIEKNLKFSDTLSLDGFFNFRLNELKTRWEDIASLAKSNAAYLSNENTLNELLKFLMSAVSPKIMHLEIFNQNNSYKIKGHYKDSDFEYKLSTRRQLLVYLINIAPLELTLYGSFDDKNLYNRLVSIFDAKPLERKV